MEDEFAANVENKTVSQPDSQSDVTQTQAFAKRLSEATKKAKAEAAEETKAHIAESFGFDSWESYLEAQQSDTIKGRGYEPEEVIPLIKEAMKNDPEYLEAMKYKAEKEEMERNLWAQNALTDLNNTYGTAYASVNDLDKGTIDLWNKGVDLKKAYAVNNVDTIVNSRLAQAKTKQSGKDHLTELDNGASTASVDLSAQEIRMFKLVNPGVTDEQIRDFVKKSRQK